MVWFIGWDLGIETKESQGTRRTKDKLWSSVSSYAALTIGVIIFRNIPCCQRCEHQEKLEGDFLRVLHMTYTTLLQIKIIPK